MLEIKDLSLSLGGKELYNRISLTLLSNDKVGLIGANGSGKSSLLKCIVGELEHDFGSIEHRGTFAYLAQETHKEHGMVDNSMRSNVNPVEMSIEEYLILEHSLDVEPWEIQKYMSQMNMNTHTCETKIGELSGGQKVKIDIIKLLVQKPDLLILDEPTNFLDIPTAEWLMKYMINYEKGLLVVSHDLRLMNRALTRIWYLDDIAKKVSVFNGNYEKFLESKAQQDEWLVKSIKQQEKRAKAVAQSAAAISGRGATKEKQKAAKKRVQARELAQEAKDMAKGLRKTKRMNLRFEIDKFSSKFVLEVDSISKKYAEPVLRDVSFKLERAERMVILGKNGVGKTTLLKILSGNVEADSGEYDWGYNVDFGYYAQEYEGLDYNKSLLDNMQADERIISKGHEYARKVLGAFLFSGDDVHKPVSVLSGGEKTRLAMAKIIAGGYNTLLLDEPTTYLDPESIVILLDALSKYEGTVILVSHEPDFVKKFAPDRVLLMPEERFTYYSENYLDRVGIV